MMQQLHSSNRNIQYLNKNSMRAKQLTEAVALDLQP